MFVRRSFRPAARLAPQSRQAPSSLFLQLSQLSQRSQLSQISHSSRSPASATSALKWRWPSQRPSAAAQLLPANANASAAGARRWETSVTGDDMSGHIAAKPGEGILFLDNVYPLRLGTLLGWRPWRTSTDYTDAEVSGLLQKYQDSVAAAGDSSSPQPSDPSPSPPHLRTFLPAFDTLSLVQNSIPANMGLTVTEIVPRLKDGGVFIKFKHDADQSPEAIEAALAKSMHAQPVRPWFNPLWGCMRAGLVRGVPWLEDLASRVPSGRMRIDFCSPMKPADAEAGGDASGSANLELSQETIYSLFRRYGKIAEITSQPSESKLLPRFATIDFLRVRDAVMARSCLHGFVVNGTTRLRLSYEPRVRAHHIWDWLTNHPRIVIPILAALLAAVTVAVFDPIRTFFIRAHIQRSFALRDTLLYKWFLRRTSDVVAFARDKYDAAADGVMGSGRSGHGDAAASGAGHSRNAALLSHRRDLLDALNTWLLETAETFVVVQGPRGSGKHDLVVEQALKGRRDVLVIDCKPIVEARGESATIKRMATAVGYRPVFSWANNLSSLIDLAVQGTTGVKTGFSETLDEQLAKILQTTATALRQVGLSGRHKTDPDASLNEDAFLEAHPERRPVIVLEHFGHRNDDAPSLVYDKLAEWAATLVQANVAHVIFLTTDTSNPKSLVKALPDRVFRQIALGDLSPAVAKNYVLSHLQSADNLETPQADEQSAATTTDEHRQPQQLQKKKDGHAQTIAAAKEGQVAAAPSSAASASLAAHPTTSASWTANPDNIHELDEGIGILGGRLTDLESLVRRLKSGQTPRRAVSEIVEQSASEIIKMFLLTGSSGGSGGGSSGGGGGAAASAKSGGGGASTTSASAGSGLASAASSAGRTWTPEQAWYLVREIGAHQSLRYNEVLLADAFAAAGSTTSSVAALDALSAAELITVRSARGRPQTIRAGSPVYQAAFDLLRSDAALAARLDRCLLAEQVALEGRNVAKVEAELIQLATLPKQPPQTAARITYLLGKLQAAQTKIVAHEAAMARLKKVLLEEV